MFRNINLTMKKIICGDLNPVIDTGDMRPGNPPETRFYGGQTDKSKNIISGNIGIVDCKIHINPDAGSIRIKINLKNT